MKFHRTPLNGAFLVEPERHGDERGFFARVFCEREFGDEELETSYVQMNISVTEKRGTLRGLHYQLPPAAEVKLVRAAKGRLYDLIVDLRPDSPTFRRWFGAELNDENRLMMYVPRGFAHAFLTLADQTEAMYLVSASYSPDHERGVRYDDPAIGIEWPLQPLEISEKDRAWPDLNPAFHGLELMRGLK